MVKTKGYTVFFYVCLILFSDYAYGRKSGGGGGGSRGGGSAARMNPQPHQPAPGGHPGGGFGGPPHGAPHPGPVGGGGFVGGRPQSAPGAGPGHLGSGTGLGSASRGSSFKHALAGAAVGALGGILAYEAGKAIITSFDKPMHYDNKDYYFGQEYTKRGPDDIICSYDFQELMKQTAPPADGTAVNSTVEENSKALAQATFPNGTRPKQIVWTCKKWEQCCGMDCCPSPQLASKSENNHSSALSTLGKILLMFHFSITIASLLFCCCCFLIIYKFFRSAFDSLFNRDNNNSYDPSKFENNQNSNLMPNQPVQAQSYPMQPYPNQQSVQNQSPAGIVYPSQPPAPPAYPAYPPAPGYYDSQQQKY
ncbi:CX domain-containing protein [Meloidogyne graminicola]|uniref:CX domain-containing protein n=1 Tax=Meloidogyne graminicola TaxID=189291 RepID=A0A8S9ZGN3_9BILA|nr:CX domain-containing protein [Meloidogyne graminicola]